MGYLKQLKGLQCSQLGGEGPGEGGAGARFSKVPVTFLARNQIFKSKYKE